MRKFVFNLRLFFESARLSYIALFRWLRPGTYAASKIIMPLADIMFFTFIGIYANGVESAPFYVIGNAMHLAAINGIYGVTMSIGGDRWEGTLPYLFGVPGSRLSFFLGRAFFHLIDGSLNVVIGLLLGWLIWQLDFSQANLPLLGAAIATATIATCGMGLALGAVGLVTVNIMFINNLFFFLLLIFAGANVPIEQFPNWMQVISQLIPLTRSIAAARLIIDGARLADVQSMLITELLIGAAYALLGFAIFRAFEYQARLRGTLEAI